MKYQTIFMIFTIGMLGAISVPAWTLFVKSAEAQAGCEWEPIPGSDEITCVPVPWIILNPQPLPPMGNLMMFNPQHLSPSINCPMCGAIALDSSILSSNTEIKISPQKDGSIIISTINSTSAPNLNATNSTNQS